MSKPTRNIYAIELVEQHDGMPAFARPGPTPGSMEYLLPFATSVDEDGDEIITHSTQGTILAPGFGYTEFCILVPGMCGHFSCGGEIRACLN